MSADASLLKESDPSPNFLNRMMLRAVGGGRRLNSASLASVIRHKARMPWITAAEHHLIQDSGTRNYISRAHPGKADIARHSQPSGFSKSLELRKTRIELSPSCQAIWVPPSETRLESRLASSRCMYYVEWSQKRHRRSPTSTNRSIFDG